MRYDVILFDLDGTLTDPGVGITNSVSYALQKCGVTPPPREALYPFIGPPLLDAFSTFYGFSPTQCQDALCYYREYFSETGIFENKLYDGIPDLLAMLCQRGLRLALATSKPELFARQILAHFDLTKYFSLIAGSTMDETRTAKDEVIAYALDGLVTPCSALMVGDRKHDVLGAKRCGLDSLGVLYGYGSREELLEAGATYLAEDLKTVATISCMQA